MVKNLPAMQVTRVQPLGREGPLEKGMANHSNILAWRIPWTDHGVAELDMTEGLTLSLFSGHLLLESRFRVVRKPRPHKEATH